ncbi:MAG: sugar phosphate isomerase/epimerase family protein [Bacteroidia bacterium]|nr:sugar phosphate isomerase/epimerase family protein [Bacteroidia bacterium]
MSDFNRRDFIKKSAIAATGLGFALNSQAKSKNAAEPLFKISLAEWSINRSLFSKKIDHLDFPLLSRKHGIEAVEYVNQFFMDKAEDKAYLREMKSRADGEGVRSLLIMCDREGALGDPDEAKRKETVDNHKKWVQAAKYLGCHSIRVNGFSSGSWGAKPDDFDESMKLVSDGLRMLCEYADDFDINVMIENHGGNSSNAKWLAGVMKMADHPRAGTLPDFGNFRIWGNKKETLSYDAYRGVEELMPLAKGVSVKIRVWDDEGNESDLDYDRMMKIVLDAGYRGYCGIEHGEAGREWESIVEVKDKLLACRDRLAPEYSK